jgi:4-carboxymuconolactone decarboxylase
LPGGIVVGYRAPERLIDAGQWMAQIQREQTMSEHDDTQESRRERGLRVLKEMGWGDNPMAPVKAADPAFWGMTVDNLFGEVWGRPGLSLRDREMVTMAVLIALDRARGLRPHLERARGVGITDDEIKEIIIQVMYYAGWSTGAHAMFAFSEVLAAREAEKQAAQKDKPAD